MENGTKSKLEYALALAEMGFHVFPVQENAKFPPLIQDFPNYATMDKEKITKWFSNGHANSNIGISTSKFKDSEALLVTDIDTKDKKMGESERLKLELEGVEFSTTCEQLSANGGRHLIYSVEKPVGQHKISDAIDIRSGGGYILGEGSTVNGKGYKLIRREVARAPKSLIEICGKPKLKSQNQKGIIAKTAETRAREYLKSAAPAIEGQNGDQQTFIVASKLKDFGCDQFLCFDLMSELWNESCTPPWEPDELRVKIENAYRYGQNPIGQKSPELDFDAIPSDTVKQPTKTNRIKPKYFDEVKVDFNQRFLVEKMLSPNAASVVYGESNSGKTFFVLDLALHIALGRPWNDLEVEGGAVIYVAAEGGYGIKKRIEAFRQFHKLQDTLNVPFALVDIPIDLKKDAKELIEVVKQAELKFGQKVSLIVVDTLARTLGEGNENEAKDMGAFIQTVDAIKVATSAHFLLVHHTGKDTSKGARGHSSLRGAVDTEILIEDNTAKTRKQRDMEYGPDIGFRLQEVVIGHDAKGKPVTSCVLQPAAAGAANDFSKAPLEPNSVGDKGMKALHAALEWASEPAPNELGLGDDARIVPIDAFRQSFIDLFYSTAKKPTQMRYFLRAVSYLFEKGYINKNDMSVWLI